MKRQPLTAFGLPCTVTAFLLLAALSGCAALTGRNAETVSTAGGRDARAAPARSAISDPRSLGREQAPVVIVEYSDYQCPYCARFHANVLPRLKSDYIDTGKIRYFFRDLPLSMHREAVPAAIAAHCAAEQGKFWAMNEALFARQLTLGSSLYPELAREMRLDTEAFRDCRQNPGARKRVQKDSRDAQGYGLNATPSFIIGRAVQGRIEIHRTARGYVDFETFTREIEALLATSSMPP